MAALRFYRQGFLLLLFDLTSLALLEKRFSDYKRCADEECSMLLCRGKAVEDFSGPDCRFLSFKKSETIYVYYKLSGRRGDLWAGSVGSNFGYFPKDLLAVNHLYTDKEIEIPAEETDFVCFDTGYDKFNNYDVDLLLGFSLEQNEGEDKETYNQIQTSEGAQVETQPSVNEETDSEKENEHQDTSEDYDEVPDDESASLPELEPYEVTESSSTNVEEPETGTMFDVTEKATEDTDVSVGSVLENVVSERSETKDPPKEPSSEMETELVSIFEGVQMPELKTTLGSTFDAVTTNEDITTNVTPYEEEESNPMESPPDSDIDVIVETPLLSFSGKTVNTPASDELKQHESPPTTHDDKSETAEEKNMWTSLGDAVFSVVTGGEMAEHDLSSSEEDEDEDIVEEEATSKPSTSIEQVKDIEEVAPVELSQEPDNIDPVRGDPSSSSAPPDNQESNSDLDKLVFDSDDESEGEVIRPEEGWEETLKPGELSLDPVSQDDTSAVPEAQKSDLEMANEDIENREEMSKDSEVDSDEEDIHDTSYTMEHSRFSARELAENKLLNNQEETVSAERFQYLYTEDKQSDNSDVKVDKRSQVDGDNAAIQGSKVALESSEDLATELMENKTVTIKEELVTTDAENHHDPSMEDVLSENSNLKSINNQKTVDASLPKKTVGLASKLHDRLMASLKINISQPELPTVEPKTPEELLSEEFEDAIEERNEQLLEDENAFSFHQSKNVDFDKPLLETTKQTASTPEPEYSDSVLRLTLLRDHFTEESMERVQNLLGLKNLFKVEAMFSDLDTELQATRRLHTGTTQDIETALESILEASENTILDEIEKMLDSQGTKQKYDQQVDTGAVDEETEILDDFQELAFSLRQKYSTASDSTPLAAGKESDMDLDEHELNVKDDTPHIVEEDMVEIIPEAESDDNFTVTDHEERRAENKNEQIVLDEAHSVEEDGGHFNKNKDNQPSFSASEEMHKGTQANLQNPLDVGLNVEGQHTSSGSVEINEEEVGLLSTGIIYMGGIFLISRSKMAEWTVAMISLLPEEWKPGETLFGCPWPAVVTTALVGVVTLILFFWRTVLAVKKREYLVDQKRLADQIQALKQEKNDALTKLSKLEKRTEQLKEDQKQSKETVSSTMKRIQDLESKLLEAHTLNENITEENHKYAKLLEEERESSLQTLTRIEKLEKSKEKVQLSRDKIQQALSQTSILLDEAKIREDARSVQHKCLQKDYTVLKEENNKLKVTIKDWEDKHEELNKQIKVYQKSQKELEESVMLKDHNLEVMSDLLADLEACDSQKGGASVLANGELEPDKKMAMKNRIKQMMDISRVQATLSVVEEERDRFMTKLLNEEKVRKSLEGQHQELEHAIATLKSEKSQVENQFKMLQQKNEIMVEMYQQKESALQQRLTKEEMERRSKETMLSEAGGKALEAEEQVKALRKRISEMEEQMKQTEEVYKEQIKEQENKTHSNWINARNAERALNQEKFESSKLKDKLAVLTSQLNERRAPLFRPNSGQPTGPRQGDSYGPSPVSGGAPSPPPMIDGQRRPPSAPVGPRIDPYYGPRPPSDPHGRYAENKHNPGMDMMGPRNSSPANMDGTTQAVDPQVKAETQTEVSTDSPEPGPGSFLASPIRDSPGPLVQGPPPGPIPYEHLPPLGRLPPPGPYRPPRPGPYNLPPGPHGPPIPPNGPMGDFSFRPTNGHEFLPRPGYGHPPEPWGPPPPQFRPPPPNLFGPGIRGPSASIPTDMRFHGPREHHRPPMNLPPGVPPNPVHSNAFVQAPPSLPQNSAGPPSDPTQGLLSKQESAQDSVRPEITKP